MKVLIVTSTPFHLGHLAREFARLGHIVEIVTYMPKIGWSRYKMKNVTIINCFFKFLPLSFFALQGKVHRLQVWAKYKLMPRIDYEAVGLLRRKEYDVVVGLSGVALECIKVANEQGLMTFLDRGASHILEQLNILQVNHDYPMKFVKRELSGYTSAQKIVIPSVFVEKGFCKYQLDHKTHTINYGMTFIDQKDIDVYRDIDILFVGPLTYQKGADIMREMVMKGKTIHHIGSYPDGKLGGIISLGVMSNSKVLNFMERSKVLLLPSRQDGFGMVMLEALSVGTPIVSTRFTGALDIWNRLDKPWYVSVVGNLNADNLIEAIDVLGNKVMSRQEGLAFREAYSWKEYGKEYNRLINE